MKKLAFCTALALTFARPAYSQNVTAAVSSINLYTYVGFANFSGSLSESTHAPIFGLSLFNSIGTPNNLMGGTRSTLALDYIGIRTQNDGYDFPFTHDKTITMGGWSAIPGGCVLTNYAANICLGIGWASISVREKNTNRQSYGSPIFSLYAPYRLASGLTAGVALRFFGVDQTVNGKYSHFEVTTYGISVGWVFEEGAS